MADPIKRSDAHSLGAKVVADVGEIHTRLFDHRAIINAEIKYFVREFEEGNKDDDVERIFRTLETVTELGDSGIERVTESITHNVSSLNQKLSVITQLCERVAEMETRGADKDRLKAEREGRTATWDKFMQSMCEKSDMVDSEYEGHRKQITEEHEKRVAELDRLVPCKQTH